MDPRLQRTPGRLHGRTMEVWRLAHVFSLRDVGEDPSRFAPAPPTFHRRLVGSPSGVTGRAGFGQRFARPERGTPLLSSGALVCSDRGLFCRRDHLGFEHRVSPCVATLPGRLRAGRGPRRGLVPARSVRPVRDRTAPRLARFRTDRDLPALPHLFFSAGRRAGAGLPAPRGQFARLGHGFAGAQALARRE